MRNTQFQTTPNGTADGFDTLAVPRKPRQQATFCPAAIAIHDDRNVTRADAIMDSRLSRRLSLFFEPALEWHRRTRSDLHQLFLFFNQQLIYFSDRLIRQLLDLVLGTTLIVFGDFLIF